MAEAIVCDLCGKVETGRPSAIHVEHRTRLVVKAFKNLFCFGDYEEIKKLDLCSDCAQKFLDEAKEGER